ncbi:MAG: GNAT family protein [Steroidobacteraceae bacterium]
MNDEKLTLRTARLELVATTLVHIEAELAGAQLLGALLGVRVPASWPPGEFDHDALKYFRSQLQKGGPACEGWYSWYGISTGADGQREQLVAAAGYFGPPSDGQVEIGYSVIPEARGRGFAAEIVRALVDRAFEQSVIGHVIAHTNDANVPSTKLLLRQGFRRVVPGAGAGMIMYRKDQPAP